MFYKNGQNGVTQKQLMCFRKMVEMVKKLNVVADAGMLSIKTDLPIGHKKISDQTD